MIEYQQILGFCQGDVIVQEETVFGNNITSVAQKDGAMGREIPVKS